MTENKKTVMVCQHCSCLEKGSAEVLAAFQAADLPEEVEIVASDCQGQCSVSPTVRILPEETWYCRVKPEDVPLIVEENLHKNQRVQSKLNPSIHRRFHF